jgi:hypothetical protein
MSVSLQGEPPDQPHQLNIALRLALEQATDANAIQ